MSTVKIIAGDISKGSWSYTPDIFGRSVRLVRTFSASVDLKGNLERVEIQTEESIKKLAGTAGWGLVGMALLGPLGAIGGMLIGGRGKEVVFAAYLKDGRKFLATTDGKTYQKITALAF